MQFNANAKGKKFDLCAILYAIQVRMLLLQSLLILRLGLETVTLKFVYDIGCALASQLLNDSQPLKVRKIVNNLLPKIVPIFLTRSLSKYSHKGVVFLY